MTPSADWYADPLGRHDRRYWDGSRWTEHVTSRGVPAIDFPDAPRTPAGWYPDPHGRHHKRYWSGEIWSEHVVSNEVQSVDPLAPQPAPQVADRPQQIPQPKRKVERQVGRAGIHSGQRGGGTVFSEQVLVVNQKAKLIGNRVEYAIYDQHGRQISAVRESSRGMVANALSVRPPENRTRKLQVVDLDGREVLAMTRPANVLKSTMIVRDMHGAEVGRIIQKTVGVFGGARFVLESGGRSVGSMKAEGGNAWDFGIQDGTGSEIARITKTWAGWAKERFTKADNYVVEIHQTLQEPLRSLVLAAALTIDVALKEGEQTRKTSRTMRRRYQ